VARIIVIDDEELIVRVAERILRAEHDVTAFVDPAEGLAHLLAAPAPDLVLCDVSMPSLDGVELYRRIVAAAPTIAERFVFLSGGATKERVRAELAVSGVAQFDKPFTAAELRAMVRERTATAERSRA
jgi:two-component system OmpR family response regulator